MSFEESQDAGQDLQSALRRALALAGEARRPC